MASSLSAGLVLELLYAAVPDVPLNTGVASATTGTLAKDALPLLTMAPCLKTLALYWRRQRYMDFALFAVGFLLAIIYHWLHIHPEGIANAQLLGLAGRHWRALDILMAQALLARTLGHAVGARTTLLHFLSNLAFPAALLAYSHLLGDGVLTLGLASKVLLAVLLATLGAKAALEGWHTLPRYCPRRGRRTLACFVAGFAVFPLPELFPRHYWLFHSLWHLAMADGYQRLYLQLEGLHLEEPAASSASAATSSGWPSCPPSPTSVLRAPAPPPRRARSSQRLAALPARKAQ